MPRLQIEPDVSLDYEEKGSGPLFILNHGLGGNSQSLRNHLEFWAPHFRAVAYDQRGCGDSDRPQRDNAYSFDQYGHDLAALIRGLGASEAVVYGVSWGGYVALKFALLYPEMTRALILDSSSSEVNQQAAANWYNRGKVVLEQGHDGLQNLSQTPAFPGNASAVVRQPAQTRSAEEIARLADPKAYFAQAAAIASTYETPLTPLLKDLHVPTLILAGGQDSTAGAGGSVKMSRNLPNARLHILQEAGHGVMGQRPDEVRPLMMDWLREVGALEAKEPTASR
jgi:pimeloyl-ACP methyl ester carboxylesterase